MYWAVIPAEGGAILVEIRNLHYDNNSWALRNEDLEMPMQRK
jgi:hypothetical protein